MTVQRYRSEFTNEQKRIGTKVKLAKKKKWKLELGFKLELTEVLNIHYKTVHEITQSNKEIPQRKGKGVEGYYL